MCFNRNSILLTIYGHRIRLMSHSFMHCYLMLLFVSALFNFPDFTHPGEAYFECYICACSERAIPSSNIDLHFAHCSRNLEKCKVCGDMVPRRHAEEHFLNTHAPVCKLLLVPFFSAIFCCCIHEEVITEKK